MSTIWQDFHLTHFEPIFLFSLMLSNSLQQMLHRWKYRDEEGKFEFFYKILKTCCHYCLCTAKFIEQVFFLAVDPVGSLFTHFWSVLPLYTP